MNYEDTNDSNQMHFLNINKFRLIFLLIKLKFSLFLTMSQVLIIITKYY